MSKTITFQAMGKSGKLSELHLEQPDGSIWYLILSDKEVPLPDVEVDKCFAFSEFFQELIKVRGVMFATKLVQLALDDAKKVNESD